MTCKECLSTPVLGPQINHKHAHRLFHVQVSLLEISSDIDEILPSTQQRARNLEKSNHRPRGRIPPSIPCKDWTMGRDGLGEISPRGSGAIVEVVVSGLGYWARLLRPGDLRTNQHTSPARFKHNHTQLHPLRSSAKGRPSLYFDPVESLCHGFPCPQRGRATWRPVSQPPIRSLRSKRHHISVQHSEPT
jgi:hypothetical protein